MTQKNSATQKSDAINDNCDYTRFSHRWTNFGAHLPIYDWAEEQFCDALGFSESNPADDFDIDKVHGLTTGWLDKWTQDNDGTIRFGWDTRAEVEDLYHQAAVEWRQANEVWLKDKTEHQRRVESGLLIGDWPGSWEGFYAKAETEEMMFCRIALKAFSEPDILAVLQTHATRIEATEYKELVNEANEMLTKKVTPIRPDVEVEPQPAQSPKKEQTPAGKRANQILDSLLADNDAELERLASTPWLIDGLLPLDATGMLYGPSGVYKSFLTLHMAASIATGTSFAGMDIGHQGDVVYVAAEGGAGVRKRLRGWEQYYGKKAEGVRIVSFPVLMDNREDRRLMLAAIKEMQRRTKSETRLVIIDTLSQTTEGDDNSNKDMAAYATACAELKEALGCSVIFVHHTGKTEDGYRGAYALTANADFVFSVTSERPLLTRLENCKSKDSELAPVLRFAMEPINIDGLLDYKLRPLTTLVPRAMGLLEEGEMLNTLAPREQILMDALEAQTNNGNGLPECDRKQLRNDFIEAMRTAEPDAAEYTVKKAFTRALEGCAKKGMLRFDATTVTRLS